MEIEKQRSDLSILEFASGDGQSEVEVNEDSFFLAGNRVWREEAKVGWKMGFSFGCFSLKGVFDDTRKC